MGLSHGQEMRLAWAGLQREAVEAAAWLGGDEEVTEPLTQDVDSAVDNGEVKGFQRAVIKRRE